MAKPETNREMESNIIHCRDCKYYFDWAYDTPMCEYWHDDHSDMYPEVKPEWFCSQGEKRLLKKKQAVYQGKRSETRSKAGF